MKILLSLRKRNANKHFLLSLFVFVTFLFFSAASQAQVTINSSVAFTSLDGSGQDFDGLANGTFVVNGDLTINNGGSINGQDGLILTDILIQVNGSLIINNGGGISGNVTGAGIMGGQKGRNITVTTNANITLNAGATITSNGNGFGCGDGGDITLTALTGNIDILSGSLVQSFGCSAGFIDIQTKTKSGKIHVDGTVESHGVESGQSPNQPKGGGPIRIVAGCNLTVTPDGIISSQGQDPGADLVHLEACVVNIYGIVRSFGAGHAVPHINGDPSYHTMLVPPTRPDKPATSTAGVEIWASDSVNIYADRDVNPTHTAEVYADLSIGAGSRTWIDIFAKKFINIYGSTNGIHPFAVHANNGGNNNAGGIITTKSIQETINLSGRAYQADGGFGGAGGWIRTEAAKDLNYNGVTIEEGTGVSHTGGTLDLRSFNGNINSTASTTLNVDGFGSSNGIVNRSACGTVGTATIINASTINDNPGICGGNPSLPCVQDPDPSCTCTCVPYVILPTGCENACGCTASITIVKTILRNPGLDTEWNFTSNIPGHTSFTLHPLPELAGGTASVTFTGIAPGSYTVTETLINTWTTWNTCMGSAVTRTDSSIASIVIAGCENDTCTFFNNKNRTPPLKDDSCFWCNKSAVLSQVWQNIGNDIPGNYCYTPDIIVDVRLPHSTPFNAANIGTNRPTTWSIQQAVDYVNANGDPSPSTPNEIFIGVIASDCVPIPLCGLDSSRSLAGDNPHGTENVIVENKNTQRLNIFGCSVTMWGENPNLPVMTVQNSKGKVTVLDIHVKNSKVQGYLVKNNTDLVVVKNSAAWTNDIGYDVQDDNVQVTGAQHINGNRIGILVQGGPNVILRTNKDIMNNKEVGVKITGNGNESNGSEAGGSGNPNGVGMIVTGNNNNLHDDDVNYNTGDGIVIAGNGNTVNGDDAQNNGGRGIVISGNSNIITGNKQVKYNGGDGIFVSGKTNNLQGNEGSNNGGHGINADQANGATGNTLKSNAAKTNSAQGIRACGQTDGTGNTGSGNVVDPQVSFACPGAAKFFVTDINKDKGYKYDASFNLVASVPLTGNNSDATDATSNGVSTYTLDKADKQVYKYVGGNAVSKTLKSSAAGNLSSPNGIAIAGDDLWVVDGSTKILYRYSLAAAYSGAGTINAAQQITLAAANTGAEAVAIDPTYLYVLDKGTKQFFRYPRVGGAGVASKVMKDNAGGALGNPVGAVLDGGTMWIVDDNKDKAYQYNLVNLFAAAGNLNAAAVPSALYSLNVDATGIALGTASGFPREEETMIQSSTAVSYNFDLQAYPNPTLGKATIRFNSSLQGEYLVKIVDITGRTIVSEMINATIGINYHEVDLSQMPKGVYMVIMQNTNMEERIKLTVQ